MGTLLFFTAVAFVSDVDKKQPFANRVDGLKINLDTQYEKAALSDRAGATIPSFTTTQQTNNPPDVRIMAPKNNSLFEWNTNVRYAISVSDEEDGKSEYQEITPNEVLLEVVYLSDFSKAAETLSNPTNVHDDPAGLALLRNSDCFNCHAVKTKLQGPAFEEIAKRYPRNLTTSAMLAKRVIRGHSGVWGNVAMPPHPDFAEEQAGQIITWILENAADPNRSYYAGIEGTFRTTAKPATDAGGAYVLTASYTDHGLKGTTQVSQRGRHTIVLHSK